MAGQGIRMNDEKKIEIGLAICALYEDGEQTIISCCKNNGVKPISWNTFWRYKKDFDKIDTAYKKAQDFVESAQMESIKLKARNSIEKCVEGYEVRETKVTMKQVEVDIDGSGQLVLGVQKTTEVRTKHIQPNPTLLIYASTNTDPKNFRNKHQLGLAGVNGGELIITTKAVRKKNPKGFADGL